MIDCARNMSKAYGIPSKYLSAMDIPADVNTEILAKINVLDWCGEMRRMLDTIEHTVRNAPVENTADHAKVMWEARRRMNRARHELDSVLFFKD